MTLDNDPFQIPEKKINVIESGRNMKKDRIVFDLCTVSFSTTALESYASACWEPVIHDAMVVAAAIEYGDKIIKRHPRDWARRISLCIPVHDPDRWNAPEVSYALRDTVEFLTGDYWTISFTKRLSDVPPPSQSYLNLPGKTQAVLAYSDGMDSRAVAGIVGATLSAELVPVRVGSRTKDHRREKGKREPFTAVPYTVQCNVSNRETSARSRGFKFALISGIAAYLTEAEQIINPESGQGAIGPALVTVGHAYPDFRNHPLFTRRMEHFLKALLGKQVRYVFPRIWNTKGETLREFVSITNSTAWESTRSCWRNSQWSSVNGKRRQCGVCAACMLRRISVYAAGLTERADTYICTNMSATCLKEAVTPGFTRLSPAFEQYAIAGVLHMDHLADMANEDARPLVTRHAKLLGPILGLSPKDAADRLTALLNRHAEEWKKYASSLGKHSFVKKWAQTDDD